MFANREVASRHLPVAHKRNPKAEKGEATRERRPEPRRSSEVPPRVVALPRNRDAADPYADMPFTD